ncbi:MAG TPA: stalk domain-containing protein [Caldisericia bacterium]|nr:stalk domain-containing protein [Caldisericia bacterium]HPF48993.1 stalk domain-containing protein [Caldisericia bacterium]HPI83143.1 stalk domain-containing protein [Caldisericia bacterium]HPQ92370.1 stalk domain-containing protein [Caldisericia bacterium]HRV74532.1 stalk domain-containing protein [Caldisericia bacterium]
MKKFCRLIVYLLSVVVIISFINPVLADVGIIKVELNYWNDSVGAARANAPTSIHVFLNFNKDIKIHEWIKIWFPTDEASCDPNDVCKNHLEYKRPEDNPRYLPPKGHFFDSKDNQLGEVGRLYEVTDNVTGDTIFYETSLCQEPEGNCRIVKDPNSDGYLLMGTIFPALPKDDEKRYEKLYELYRMTSIGYTPCGKCGTINNLVQTCNESSIKLYAYMLIEAWRQGYNPIDINIYKKVVTPPATPGRYRLRVATQPEPTPIESESFVLPCSSITKPKLVHNKGKDGGTGRYFLTFNVGEGGALDVNSSRIYIQFPDCINPARITFKDITFNGAKLDTSQEIQFDKPSNSISFIGKSRVDNFGLVRIELTDDRLINTCDDDFSIQVYTSSEPEPVESEKVQSSFGLSIKDIAISNNRIAENSNYSFSIIQTSECMLKKGDKIDIIFPETTNIPPNINPVNIFIDGKPCSKVAQNSYTLMLIVPEDIKDYSFDVVITENAGIINTLYPGFHRLLMQTKCNEYPVPSPLFELEMLDLEVNLVFSNPEEPDGCDGWFRTPPTIDFECNHPLANIYVSYISRLGMNGIEFKGKWRVFGGTYIEEINYYAELLGEKTETKTRIFKVDTIYPAIVINHPYHEITHIGTSTFTVRGTREPEAVTVEYWEDNLIYDGLAVQLNNNQEIILHKPEMVNIEDKNKIDKSWSHTFQLVEGENTITFRCFDQACNEFTKVYTVNYDTVNPPIEIINPPKDYEHEYFSTVTITVKTEADALVTINDKVASIVEYLDDDMAIFDATIEIQDIENTVRIKVVDRVGRTSREEFTFLARPRATTLKLWIDSPDFMVNGIKSADLDPMPTSKSPPLPANLAGNTYMPVRAILEALGAEIGWDATERRVDVTLAKPDGTKTFLQLWIDKPTAKLDGKEVQIVGADGKTALYPTIVGGRTMLPLRFAVESVGGSVGWIASEQAIEIVYPADNSD